MNTKLRSEGCRSARRDVIRGTAQQVISVRVPVPGVFREAVFFLNEDYLRRSDSSREALLEQARASAEEYLQPFLPTRKTQAWWPYPLFFLLGTGLGFTVSIYFGI